MQPKIIKMANLICCYLITN